jgi:imidazolonepropionase-like amidohydrolase
MRLPVNRRSSGHRRSARKFFSYSTTILITVFLAACAEQTEPDASPASAANSTPSGTAITNITVIDGVNGVRANQTVLFEGDQITAVQDAALAVDAQEVIDGSGKFLIPGLWDFHVHLTYDPRLTAAMSDLFLSYGITSVRDTGGLLENVLPVVATMREEGAVAPRVFFAGPLLDGEHVVYDGVGRPEIGVQNVSVEQARERVAELRNQGASFIKVYEMVSPAVFDALVAAANELGMPIDSHVPLSLRARDAGAVVSSIEHLRNIEMDCAANAEELHATRLQLLENPDAIAGADLRASLHALQRLPAVADYSEAECDAVIAALANTVMVPTLRLNSFNLAPVWQRDDFDDALERLPADVRDEWRAQAVTRSAQPAGDIRFAEWSLFLTERMHNAGVPFGAGTDTPINLSVPGYSLHSELEMLVRAGLSPLEALSAATLEPARFFSLESEMGTIEAGKVADLVLLDADPLDAISNTKRINLVVSKGQIVSRD